MGNDDWHCSAVAAGFDPSDFRDYREYVATRAKQRLERRAPFMTAAEEIGIPETYDRFTGKKTADPRLFELALGHLRSGAYDDETRGWVARMLESREAAPYWNDLAALFRGAPAGSEEQEGLAASLAASARAAHVPQMKQFVLDPDLGEARIYFLRPINRLDRAGGKAFVAQFADDPTLGRETTAIIRKWSRSQG